jgi:sulfonate transport system permease protein
MNRVKGLLLPGVVILGWMTASTLFSVNSYLLPSPGRVLDTLLFLTGKGILLKHVTTSLYRVFYGFGIAFFTAFPAAVLLGMNPGTRPFVEPLLHFIRHIPPIACIPLLILWFGIGEMSKIAVIVLAAFFPIFLNTLTGVLQCDVRLLEVAKIFDLTSGEKFRKIIVPSALPAVIAGMRLGLGYSWRALMGAELIAASAGIGYMILDAEQLSRPDVVLAGILVIGIVGYGMDYAFLKLSGLILPWKKVKNGGVGGKGTL